MSFAKRIACYVVLQVSKEGWYQIMILNCKRENSKTCQNWWAADVHSLDCGPNLEIGRFHWTKKARIEATLVELKHHLLEWFRALERREVHTFLAHHCPQNECKFHKLKLFFSRLCEWHLAISMSLLLA
jgi:hypothetical protein